MDIFSIGYDALYIILGVISAIVRASGVTIESGYTGLCYTLGEVDRPLPIVFRPFAALLRQLGVLKGERSAVLEPGFHPLIPFLQRVRRVPTRQRTMDLPAQRVATFEGYVFHADANIVFRIVDVRKALIVVDNLLRGMNQMLTLGVQEVLREATLRDLQSGVGLDEKLARNLAEKVEVWGVVIEGAGFPTITPSPRTLRITQARQNAMERARRVDQLMGAAESPRLSMASALGAVGTRRVFRTKIRARRHGVARHRQDLRVRASLERKGWTGAAIDRVLKAMRSGA
ncbi:SPFH domain / Band 7 family protein [Planctomycetes bacterium Poly30]|uniref:SPFH domain / Band 7 family protein n=1 Tax=Saltatorellus ferox TaxID=2528018 RepID=A0A518EQK3_9BACT|nr:SPFH domain / Band 7 family protein [Planctomycetes bacterium Poly30]